MAPGDLTFLVAIGAGLLSFLSPCVLPLVPAYLGQLTTIAVASAGDATPHPPTRWTALRHGIAYVAGFGAIFTVLGIGAAFAAGPLADYIPPLRTIGGVLLVILGLNLAGVLRIPALERSWRPLDAGATAALGGRSQTQAFAFAPAGGPTVGSRLGGRLVAGRNGWLASFGLGAIFAVGWTPCIGAILGGILGLAASSDTKAQGAILLVGYTIGLGLPFIALAALYDRAPALLRPLTRHGNVVSIVGGLLVVVIGLAMIFDLLSYIVRLVPFNTSI